MQARVTIAILAAFGLGILAGIYAPALRAGDERSDLREALDDELPELKDASRAFKKIAQLISPSIVHVVVRRQPAPPEGAASLLEFLFAPDGERETREEESQGTGVFVRADGVIVTNNHVVEGASSIAVTTFDGNMYPAEVIGTDRKTDLAVLKISARDCAAAPLGDESQVQIGDWAVAFGNPFGLTLTVTAGIISAKGRANVGLAEYEDFLQTDAAINPGNSGGALCNIQGEVIGINTAILSKSGGYQGIGFAIPISMVRTVVDQLLEHGKVMRGWIGVEIVDLPPWQGDAYGVDGYSILVQGLAEDGPALAAGMRVGDVLLELDGAPIGDVQQLRNTISLLPVGSEIRLRVRRDDSDHMLSVEVASLDDAIKRRQTPLGFTARTLTEEDARRYGFIGQRGALLIKVDPDGLAFEAGLREGDLVLDVDGRAIADLEDLEETLSEANPEAGIEIRLQRGFRTFETVIYSR